jgi:hypothetical protein
MFGWFKFESPLTAQQRCWIDGRFAWLRQQFGEEPLRKEVVTPTREFFPDRYAATPEDAAILLDRLCGYMNVDRTRLELQLYTNPTADDVAAAFNPVLRREYALGAFAAEGGRIQIWLERTRLNEPHSVVSTLAHELGHVHLLADGRCDQSAPDHEPLTDLLAIYFGLGIFMANNALREVNWHAGGWAGWSIGRQGYMAIPEYAYALALYAHARREVRPRWAKYLRPDARAYFKIEAKLLEANTVPAGSDLTGPTESVLGQPAARELPETADVPEGEAGNSQCDVAEQDDAEGNSPTGEVEPGSDQRADSHFTQGSLYAAEGEHELAVSDDKSPPEATYSARPVHHRRSLEPGNRARCSSPSRVRSRPTKHLLPVPVPVFFVISTLSLRQGQQCRVVACAKPFHKLWVNRHRMKHEQVLGHNEVEVAHWL